MASAAMGETAAPVTLGELNHFLRFNPRSEETQQDKVGAMLTSFVACNSDPKASPNLQSQTTDDMSCIAVLLGHSSGKRKIQWVMLLLQMFKILLRKETNRATLSDVCIKTIVDTLKRPVSVKCAMESANVLLNMCYDERNVLRIVQHGAVQPIVGFLSVSNPELQASACGALQSICFQTKGRDSVRDNGALAPICALLRSSSAKVVSRAVGALHNLSSDPKCISLIREADGILPLVELLHMPSTPICSSAAGAIQNVSREPLSREIICETNAVDALVDLILSGEPQVQVYAAGALLNILGPQLGAEDPTDPQRVALRSLLSDAIALGAIAACMSEVGDATGAMDIAERKRARAQQAAAAAAAAAAEEEAAGAAAGAGAGGGAGAGASAPSSSGLVPSASSGALRRHQHGMRPPPPAHHNRLARRGLAHSASTPALPTAGSSAGASTPSQRGLAPPPARQGWASREATTAALRRQVKKTSLQPRSSRQ